MPQGLRNIELGEALHVKENSLKDTVFILVLRNKLHARADQLV
jgi:hypothetical protein